MKDPAQAPDEDVDAEKQEALEKSESASNPDDAPSEESEVAGQHQERRDEVQGPKDEKEERVQESDTVPDIQTFKDVLTSDSDDDNSRTEVVTATVYIRRNSERQ